MPDPTIEETIEFIKTAHAGQFDKGGVEYWRHPVSVMKRLPAAASHDAKLVALLHDVIEDTDCTTRKLRDMGYPEAVVRGVWALTKPHGRSYDDFIDGIAKSQNWIAIAVKIADNEDNLDPERLARLSPEQQAKAEKYKRSLATLNAALPR